MPLPPLAAPYLCPATPHICSCSKKAQIPLYSAGRLYGLQSPFLSYPPSRRRRVVDTRCCIRSLRLCGSSLPQLLLRRHVPSEETPCALRGRTSLAGKTSSRSSPTGEEVSNIVRVSGTLVHSCRVVGDRESARCRPASRGRGDPSGAAFMRRHGTRSSPIIALVAEYSGNA